MHRGTHAIELQQSSLALSSTRGFDDASRDFGSEGSLELTSSMRVRKKVAIGGVDEQPDDQREGRRKGSVLFLDPAPPSMMMQQDDEGNSPWNSSSRFSSPASSPLSPARAGDPVRHSTQSPADTAAVPAKQQGDCIDSIVDWCNSLSTRAPCRIGGKRLSISLSWCVQWFLIINLTLLVIATSLLFNYYALTLVNNTAESFLYTALWQTQTMLDNSITSMKGCVEELAQSTGGATVTNTLNTSDERWPGWSRWAVPGFGLVNATQAAGWSVERRLAHVSVVEACRVMREGTVSVQLAYRIPASGWVGGCIRSAFATGVTTTSWATEFVGFILLRKRILWLQTIPGVTNTIATRQLWTTTLEALTWADNPAELIGLLQAAWALQSLPSTSSLPTVAVDVLNNQTGIVSDDVEDMVALQNTTWVLEPFSNGTIANINAVQWSRTLFQTTLFTSAAPQRTSKNRTRTVSKSSASSTFTASPSMTYTPDDNCVVVDTFTILNISANGQLAAALDRVAQTSSDGVSIDVIDNSNGAVITWASAAGYYVPPSSVITGSLLSSLLQVVVTNSNRTNTTWYTTPEGSTSSLRQHAATTWTIRVSSGDSIVGSLARGTYVVVVVCVAVAIAVSIGGLMALRLLLNPLDQVHRDIRHASALQFHRIDPSKFPPSILREMNLVTRSFLQLVKKLQSYRSVLMDVYDTSLRSRSSSLNSSSEMFGSLDGSMLGTSFASSASTGESDSLSHTSSFMGQLSSSLATGTAEDVEFLATIRKGSFVNPLMDRDANDGNEPEVDNQHLLKVHLAYISRRHSGRQRKQATFEHTYRDGAAEMLHAFRTDCLKNLQLSLFEEVRIHIQCNGVYVEVRNDTQLSDAFSVARGELLVRMSKSGIKKVLSPVALVVDLLNFAINIALITLVMIATRAGTQARLSISVFFGLYATAFVINLGITLALLKQGQQDPRMKTWLSQAGLEVSLMLIFCALNTQNIHFLWSQWSVGLKFNAPRVHLLWKRGIIYSLFGFVALDLMQVAYKVYRIIEGEDYAALTIIGLLVACLSIALSLKKRGDFILYYFNKWRFGRGQKTPGAGPDPDAEELDSFRNGATWARRPRAGMSVPMFSEEATVVLMRCCVALPDAAKLGSDPVTLQRQHNKVATQLNRFFSLVFSEVASAQGHVLWFHGTEVAVSFNSPKPLEHHTPKALKCILQIHRGLAAQQSHYIAPHITAKAPRHDKGTPQLPSLPMVAALVRDQYLFGTLGGSNRRVFQCFADWDELQRMLNFAESAPHVGIVTLKRCVHHLTSDGTAASSASAQSALSPRSGRYKPSAAPRGPKASPFLNSLIYHDVMGVDQVYVEVPVVAHGRGERAQVSLLARVLRPLGVLFDPHDHAHAVFTKFVSDCTSSTSRGALPMEETLPAKRKSVTIREGDDVDRRSSGAPAAAAGTGSAFPISALKKPALQPSPKLVLTDSDDDVEVGSEDDEPGMSTETKQTTNTSAPSSRRSLPLSPRGTSGGPAGVTLGAKDMRRMFPDAF